MDLNETLKTNKTINNAQIRLLFSCSTKFDCTHCYFLFDKHKNIFFSHLILIIHSKRNYSLILINL